MTSGIRVGIDTGGTFTDVVAVDARSGRVATTKTPSTPDDPAVGFMTGLRKALALLGDGDARPAAVCHGTTVATNALLQDDFSGLGFVTTEGFRHVLEIARQSVPDSYGNSYFWIKPDRIVPLHLVAEVPGRLDHTGEVVRPFDDDAAARVARWCRARGFDAVGVSFLHSYANPDHERRMRAVFEREYPECAISISSDVLREYREYERSVTTLVDAFVKPRTSSYVARIEHELSTFADRAAPPPFYVMKSNGGVISAPEVARAPITTILSGPAAGALGAAYVARAAGFERVLTLDGGGTSTDVSVVAGGEPRLTTEGAVGRFPVKVPMVDVVTVGTGGGSIARRSPEGNLKVGPRSAGADPGPMCYARGGEEPTLTDANVVLGRIPPHLLGGEIALDVDAARAGIDALAAALGMDADACAAGVLEVAAWNQANAIRQLTVRRGLDVRDFAMIAFGGSGPLLACTLADVLGLAAVVVPPDPGNVSALGLLTVDVRNDFVRTFVRRHADASLDEIGAVYDDLERDATAALGREGFEGDDCVVARAADLRYFGQAFEVRVPAPHGPVDSDFAAAVVAAFHDEHERRYGYCYRDDPSQVVEWVNLRVTGIGPIERPRVHRAPERGAGERLEPSGRRRAFFDGAWHDAVLHDRSALRAHDVVRGPAIVEEFGSTTPIAPGFAARVDDGGNLVIAKDAP
ncbi:MAG TPA: hydantoinase/oxoprolinase family protein [Actinomycetota bacterium]|nr:hydantoinase/oxoprolinase family protein [Actinomycetota bacterium]